MRTLGVERKSLMIGYLLAPIVIGVIGCLIGILIGPSGMNGMSISTRISLEFQ